MMIFNLPRDLLEEILARVPVKSIRAVRSTCKNWNVISKDERFANKHIGKAAAREKQYLIIGDSMDYLSSVKLYETHNKKFGLSINGKAISIARDHSDQTLYISEVFLSNGLLLYVCRNTTSISRLLLWNPYWGKIRWIECPVYRSFEILAFGCDKSCGSHKILRLSKDNPDNHMMDIYDLSSDSWRTVDVAFDKNVGSSEPGLSLKGNTFWCASDNESKDYFLHCFDFTRERFGPRLPLPPSSYSRYCVFLSSVKEEKLAVLFSPWSTFGFDIWVTNKIEDPYVVSWSRFFKVETEKTIQDIDRGFRSGYFFIDEEKKITVVFDIYGVTDRSYICSVESGHFRKVNLRPLSGAFQLVGCYVPSSVQI
ncbi:putative F-box/kelch-repeat protein [Raphanus sativus]|uniref:F-box protein At3g20705 n=1 Tax=Raphanus sativus TaxID=3726 RepID=A0A6J0JIL2_RAPSA|nr:putative F-box protein At3g20705 [Raphanus sativus]XP_056853549.1 putative F-box protein At3g20705 [Raphanus sativus]KAJ4871277.1 putative F-box/kelch-repeat protein [Raphanus sativus]KAJ4887013.1 putative F-box/kelch-repeat protein [Raphanus sativus]